MEIIISPEFCLKVGAHKMRNVISIFLSLFLTLVIEDYTGIYLIYTYFLPKSYSLPTVVMPFASELSYYSTQ